MESIRKCNDMSNNVPLLLRKLVVPVVPTLLLLIHSLGLEAGVRIAASPVRQ